MAGLGRRTFAPGEVLTATNVMGYLQDQAVMKFAGTAARGSAIGTAVAEGMVSYLADTDLIEVYNGSAWKQISGTTGNVLQVVSATYSTSVSTTSSSYVTTNLQASITPKSSSSNILVLVTSALQNTGAGQSLFTTIYRGGMAGTNLGTGGNSLISRLYQANGETLIPYTASVYDSPATTSSTTYTWAIKSGGGTITVQPDGGKATITLMEISA